MVAAVVLAAGSSTRFGSPKQRLLIEPVLERVRASSVEHVLVVLGAHSVETTAESVHCAHWEQGPGASLRCGLQALPADTEAAVVVLADGPDLAPAAIDRIVGAWRKSGREVVAATYRGERGHPVLLDRSAWSGVPNEGARGLDALAVPCDDLGAPGDVDFHSDLPGRFRDDAAELNSADEDGLRASNPPDPPAASADLAFPPGASAEKRRGGGRPR